MSFRDSLTPSSSQVTSTFRGDSLDISLHPHGRGPPPRGPGFASPSYTPLRPCRKAREQAAKRPNRNLGSEIIHKRKMNCKNFFAFLCIFYCAQNFMLRCCSRGGPSCNTRAAAQKTGSPGRSQRRCRPLGESSSPRALAQDEPRGSRGRGATCSPAMLQQRGPLPCGQQAARSTPGVAKPAAARSGTTSARARGRALNLTRREIWGPNGYFPFKGREASADMALDRNERGAIISSR